MATLREFWITFHHQKLQNLRRSAQIFQNLEPLRFFYSLNAVLRGRSSVAAEVPVSKANELERLVMEIKFRTKPNK